jgi:starch synthase
MRVLFLASEVAPYSKTGGLGDVAGALPAALAADGVEVRVVSPLYADVDRTGLRPLEERLRLRFPYGEETARLWRARSSARQEVWFVEHAGFFDRPGIYGEKGGEYPDNVRRFAFFSMAALAAAQALEWAPDIVHLNDWHAGLAALALRRGFQGSELGSARSVFTIHNLAYQGLAPPSAMAELGLPWELYTPDGLEHFGHVSLLKAGVVFADHLTTVSRRYAEEICTPAGGWGMDRTLLRRGSALTGILNGVDYAHWDPARDAHLPARFDARRLDGKARCKAALLDRFALRGEEAIHRPLFTMVSRLAPQKGIDLILQGLPQVLSESMSFVAIGSGEPHFERGLRELAARFPGKVGVHIGFEEELAHWAEAGGDFFLMPSLYEPCGLNQMYSLKYGTVPIVRATGGLDDTVVDLASPHGTGIKFERYAAVALADAVRRALALFGEPKLLAQVRRRGMSADFSWQKPALEYQRVYRALLSPQRKAQ